MFTRHEIDLIQHSFEKVMPNFFDFSQEFYGVLFTAHPELEAYFREDRQSMGRKLLKVLLKVVNHLDQLEELQDDFNALGARHTQRGIQAAYYAPFGDALVAALRNRIGSNFTAETEAAWRKVYGVMAQMSMAGM
jgi:hemoglobin-like flavoprotein